MGVKKARKKDKGHSENYFGDYRDFWWNKGFLDLMAERLQLKKHHHVLDVGCGMCHWSKLLVPYLSAPKKIYAIDNDVKWSKENPEIRAYFKQQQADLELKQGDVHALPYQDDFFDMVTCQTLLIHIKNPRLAISEMKRVLKPGGTLLCVEPNNMIQSLTKSSLTTNDPIEEILDHVKYALICERGKKKLGEGDSSIGDLVPGLLAKARFKDIEVRLSDKAIAIYPPYDSQEQIATMQQWASGSAWTSDKHTDLQYFEAFGNTYLNFYQRYQEKYLHSGERFLNAIDDKQYHAAGGAIMYLVSGIK